MPRRTLSLMQRPPEVNWPAVIAELRGYRYSLRTIGGAIALSHSTIYTWEQGGRPNYEDGKALLQLLERTRAQRRTEAVSNPVPVGVLRDTESTAAPSA